MNDKEFGTMSNKETSEIYVVRSSYLSLSNDSKNVELFFNNKEMANKCCNFLNMIYGTNNLAPYYYEKVNVYNIFNFD